MANAYDEAAFEGLATYDAVADSESIRLGHRVNVNECTVLYTFTVGCEAMPDDLVWWFPEQPADERAMAQWARESRWWAADGATRRQKAMRAEAVAKKHKGIALATRQKLFDAEHNALLALHATKAAATANNATKVFKAHKRAGKQAWLAQKLLLKLYRLRNGILDFRRWLVSSSNVCARRSCARRTPHATARTAPSAQSC